MSTTMMRSDVLVSDGDRETVRREATQISNRQVERFAVVTDDGQTRVLDRELSQVLERVCQALAAHGHVRIGTLPDELTSTVAAELVGVSRPTLLKLAQEGQVESFKVGTHTRFRRDEILRLQERRERDRGRALVQILELSDQLDEPL
ncbi:helix-turn-helix domain-containing protein [Rothia sp. AR01]|uniref:Helix-turn-helix domain-containing protein n=1 Tax=Rothia santali TaxID=2949643 RepID=A0A9X2HE92_9MICC|nr:helix-turn-helix domain-containing protein [Rothia santali]MCP3425644.1 helix-turn-helix domain-containing protein [Rothia santali]